MKVVPNFTNKASGVDDPVYHLGFENYETSCPDFYLMLGDVHPGLILTGKYDDKPKIILTLEEPNFCTEGSAHVDVFNTCSKILTICPYTAECFDNRQFVFFPFNEELIPKVQEKCYDVIYSGSIQSSFVSMMVDCMLPHKYVFINFNNDHRANHPKVSYKEKLDLYAKTKVTICHNLLYPSSFDVPRYRRFPNATNNRAFDGLDRGLMPQIKSRVFEAAFSKSVILCSKDPWNIIELFFTPDVDFVYFDGEEDLKEKLNHIVSNYDKYIDMVDSAYSKAISNYTTRHFVEKYFK